MNRYIVALFLLLSELHAEIVMEANIISYDPQTETVFASGNVHIIQKFENSTKTRELYAEKIEYNKKTTQIKLLGDSIMKEPNGDVFLAKNIKLEKKFKEAVAEALVVVLKDTSKIKAKSGNKSLNTYRFNDVSYSPCKETACSAPLWDLVANEVVYDRTKKKFVYKNVRLRIKGKSVFFLPYLEHPSFDVKRKTGCLAPIIRRSSDTGFMIGIPLYIDIKSDRSLKFTPFLNSKNRAFATAEYKQLFKEADFYFSGSFLSRKKRTKTDDEEKEAIEKREKGNRWHIDTIIKSYNLDNKQISIRFNRASDVTYKSKYPITCYKDIYMSKKYNDSNVIMEFYDTNYFLLTETHIYQTDNRKTAPAVFPHINFRTKKETDLCNIFFDSDSVHLVRDEQTDATKSDKFFRTSNKIKLQRSFNFSPFIIDLNSSLRTDTFNISDTNGKNIRNTYPVSENQVSLSVLFSSKLTNNLYSIWAPKVSLTSVQTPANRLKIKHHEEYEKSYNDLNFFAANRKNGYDFIERGEKFDFGIENSIYNKNYRVCNFFIGRSFSNIDNSSHTVGKFVWHPTKLISIRTRFVGLPITEKTQIFEGGLCYSNRRFDIGCSLVFDKNVTVAEKKGLSQLSFFGDYKINDFWTIGGKQRINLLPHGQKNNLSHSVDVTYADECLKLEFGIYRTNFKYKDIKPHTGISFSIYLKNISNFNKSINTNQEEIWKIS